MLRKKLVILTILVGLTLGTVGSAVGVAILGVPIEKGRVRLLKADSFASNADLISGWYWLRDPGYTHYGEWNFSGAPTTTLDAYIYIYFECLVTNTAGGGSGYNTYVKVYAPSNPNRYVIVKLQNLHPEFQEPYDTEGWGYSSIGFVKVSVDHVPVSGMLTFGLMRYSPNTEHVAVNLECVTVEWRVE